MHIKLEATQTISSQYSESFVNHHRAGSRVVMVRDKLHAKIVDPKTREQGFIISTKLRYA